MRRIESRTPRRFGPHGWGKTLVVLLLSLTLAPAWAHAQSGADSVTVSWRAVGDDSLSGRAEAYDLRYSTSPITAGNWDDAVQASINLSPGSSGSNQRVVVRGLEHGTAYWFAIKTVDDAGNWSGISNIARWDWIYDTAPPTVPTNISATREDEGVKVQWTPSPDPDLAGYNVYRATSQSGPFTRLNSTMITATEYVDENPPTGDGQIWYQVTARDVAGNESAHSTAVTAADPNATTSWTMEPAYPNPSRIGGTVRIPVNVPGGASQAVVEILTSGGHRIRRMDLGQLPPGPTEIQWDGRNDAGLNVAPGPYTAWLIAGSTRVSVKLVRIP